MTFKSIISKILKGKPKLKKEELKYLLKELESKDNLGEEILKVIDSQKWLEKIDSVGYDIGPILDNLDSWTKKIEKNNFTDREKYNLSKIKISLIQYLLENIDLSKGYAKNRGKFKRAGHLTDQILKYNYPKDRQPDLFSSLKETTIAEIDKRGIERSEVVEGIKLSPSETKVIDCLCKLLHNKSEVYDKEDSNYYTGNKEASIVKYGEEARDIAPRLGFTLYEFTQEYIGVDNKKVGGKDIENVSNILLELSKKDFLIKYKEEEKHKKGGRTVRELEMFEKIINLPTLRETKYDAKGIETSKKEETLVILHPIFRRQIDSKFILYPNDINKRTIIAYGSPNVSDATIKLRDYLMRELSSKHYQPEIKQERLYYLLKEKWMNESRKKKVKEYTDKALETMIDLGLLESYKIESAKTTGEPKVVFKLNKNFE